MGLPDIAGILSRRFIVGFFIPVFFVSLALKLIVDERAIPSAVRGASGGTQILIIGGVSLMLGLLLWGGHYSLIRFLEGYWLIAPTIPSRTAPIPGETTWWSRNPGVRVLRKLRRAAFARCNRGRLWFGQRRQRRWVATRKQLAGIKGERDPSPTRTAAARELTERYPTGTSLVLPSEFGNVIRAFETHPRERYGLEGIAVWPLIQTMLSDAERAALEETSTDLAFWLNSLLMVFLSGSLLFFERLWHRPGGAAVTLAVEAVVIVATWVATAGVYRQTIGAASRWGEPVRAAFDTHRLELYDRLGMRRPVSHEEDVESGRALNRLLAFAEPLPDAWRRTSAPGPEAPATHRHTRAPGSPRQPCRLLHAFAASFAARRARRAARSD